MASADVEQLCSFLRVYFGPEVAAVFIHLCKNCKSTLQLIIQQFRVSNEKHFFFPAENLTSSVLRIKKYYEKVLPPSAFETMTLNRHVSQMVQRCLAVLLTHDLVTLGRRRGDGALEYSANWPQSRVLLRAPAFLCLVRTQLGHTAELLVEELLYCGRVGLLPCLTTVAKRLQEEDEEDSGDAKSSTAASVGDAGVRALNAFAELLERRLVVRRGTVIPPQLTAGANAVSDDDDVAAAADVADRRCRIDKPFAPLSRAERETALRHLQRTLTAAATAGMADAAEPQLPPAKRVRFDDAAAAADSCRPDEAAHEFSANAEELRRQWRDALLTRAATASAGPAAGRVLAAMLAAVGERVRLGHAQSPESEVLAHVDIVAQLAATGGAGGDARAGLDQQLTVLADDGLIERLSGAAGGQFRVCYRRAIFGMTRQSVGAVVRQRVGDKAVRVFNALYEQPNLSQAELESHALVAARDCKELLYRLLLDGFVHCVELTRAADFMNPRPNTSFYLFHVNLEQAVRKLLLAMHSYQDRLLTRRLAEAAANRRLLDKQQRVKELLKNLDAQLAASGGQPPPELAEQRAQAAQLLTPPEREQLGALKRSRTALRAGELLLEENVFLFQMFLEYASEHH